MALSITPELIEQKNKKAEKKTGYEQDKPTESRRMTERHFMRRATSEQSLNDALDWHFQEGYSYHCISQGDVDSLTYLRMVVKQQHLKYLLVSTWCMAITDAEEMCTWIEKGYVDRIDFYVGEIFKGSYQPVYDYLKKNGIVDGSRIAIFRNHSKVMAGYGEKFDFAIESSANINTNPRTEQTTVCISTGLADFYKQWFDGINAFNRDFDDWRPWEVDHG